MYFSTSGSRSVTPNCSPGKKANGQLWCFRTLGRIHTVLVIMMEMVSPMFSIFFFSEPLERKGSCSQELVTVPTAWKVLAKISHSSDRSTPAMEVTSLNSLKWHMKTLICFWYHCCMKSVSVPHKDSQISKTIPSLVVQETEEHPGQQLTHYTWRCPSVLVLLLTVAYCCECVCMCVLMMIFCTLFGWCTE